MSDTTARGKILLPVGLLSGIGILHATSPKETARCFSGNWFDTCEHDFAEQFPKVQPGRKQSAFKPYDSQRQASARQMLTEVLRDIHKVYEEFDIVKMLVSKGHTFLLTDIEQLVERQMGSQDVGLVYKRGMGNLFPVDDKQEIVSIVNVHFTRNSCATINFYSIEEITHPDPNTRLFLRFP